MFKSLILFVFFLFSLHAEWSESFLTAKEKAEIRWEAFQTHRTFKPFQPGKSDEALAKEMEEIYNTRIEVWTLPAFEQAEHLIAENLVRAPGNAAFAFNNTVPYFNSSTIYIEGNYYIACEGPRSKDVPNFFQLLTSQHVTHLVRLTGAYEGWTKKCHPYWDGFLTESEGKAYLNIPTETGTYSVRAYHMDHWRDHQGIDPRELLSLVLEIKEELKKEKGLLVVHCSAGVGRTGTFLASMAIVDAIDKGLPFSIEEIVYRLSLQRVRTVYKREQYITLHRLAEAYLDLKT